MMDVKVSKTNALADRLIERTSSMLDKIESETVHKDEEGDRLSLSSFKVDSAFHPSEVDKMSTRNFWELSGKK